MAASGQIRTRSERVAALDLQPGQWRRIGSVLRNPDVMAKLGLVLVASIAIAVVIGAWNPPLSYREGFMPSRNIVARVQFKTENRGRTELARDRAVSDVKFIYSNDPTPLRGLEAALRNAIVELTANRNTPTPNLTLLQEFRLLDGGEPADKEGAVSEEASAAAVDGEEGTTLSQVEARRTLDDLCDVFAGPIGMERFNQVVEPIFKELESRGVITSLPKKQARGNQTYILVHPKGQAEPLIEVPVSEVLLGDGSKIRQAIQQRIDQLFPVLGPGGPTSDSSVTQQPSTPEERTSGDTPERSGTGGAQAEIDPTDTENADPAAASPDSSADFSEPAAESVVEPVTEPTAEPVVEPLVEPLVEPVVEPTAEPTDDATDAAAEEPSTPASSTPVAPNGTGADDSAPTSEAERQKAIAAREIALQAGDRIFAWILGHLQDSPTLEWNEQRTQPLIEQARASIPDQYDGYEIGDILADAERSLDTQTIRLLADEHAAYLLGRTFAQRLVRFGSVMILIFTMLVLIGAYMYYRDKEPLGNFWRLTIVLCLAVATMGAAVAVASDPWRAELLPIMLFGMALAIAYRPEPTLMITGAESLILTLGVGYGLFEFVLLLGVTSAAALNVSRIRNRRKLIYVGFFAGLVAVALSWVLGAINNQPLDGTLFMGGLRCGFWALMAGVLMAGLLPFIEKLFGVLTDLSLLELGDVAHPVLQELIRRAPSTYNHSIAVGTLSEAAADSIGARGLLCRVAAYFHDIGKMMGPDYFIENLPPNEESRHDSLGPSMSSLVIISHVKDGVDLAKQHHLPQPIIDMIEQHHGTTQVGFFYEKAKEQQRERHPRDDQTVDERIYRYPGPKPQTKEAGVLMLADNVESASRTLIEPTPKRIEGLVHKLLQLRLEGGQFDESGLSLRELRIIELSLVKTLTAIYHGRIQYPEATEV